MSRAATQVLLRAVQATARLLRSGPVPASREPEQVPSRCASLSSISWSSCWPGPAAAQSTQALGTHTWELSFPECPGPSELRLAGPASELEAPGLGNVGESKVGDKGGPPRGPALGLGMTGVFPRGTPGRGDPQGQKSGSCGTGGQWGSRAAGRAGTLDRKDWQAPTRGHSSWRPSPAGCPLPQSREEEGNVPRISEISCAEQCQSRGPLPCLLAPWA